MKIRRIKFNIICIACAITAGFLVPLQLQSAVNIEADFARDGVSAQTLNLGEDNQYETRISARLNTIARAAGIVT